MILCDTYAPTLMSVHLRKWSTLPVFTGLHQQRKTVTIQPIFCSGLASLEVPVGGACC